MTSMTNLQRARLLTLFLALVALGPWCRAQGQATDRNVPLAPLLVSPLPDPTVVVPTTMQPDLVVPAAPDTYPIGDGDLLSVFVYQMPDLTRQVRVDVDGKIRLPLLAQRLPAAGLTAPQLSRSIHDVLVSSQLARNPVVQVIVRQVSSKPIVVTGAVRYPGVIQASKPMTLLEVLSRAGGLDTAAGTRILLTQPSAQGDQTRLIDVSQVTESADPVDDPLLSGGETVRVLPARMVYVVGAFAKPGAFPLRAGEGMSVLKAVALAQGIKNPADKSGATILRNHVGGSQAVLVNLDKILKHKLPDPEMQAGDILFLPESTRGRLLESAGSVTAQAAAIFIGYTLVR